MFAVAVNGCLICCKNQVWLVQKHTVHRAAAGAVGFLQALHAVRQPSVAPPTGQTGEQSQRGRSRRDADSLCSGLGLNKMNCLFKTAQLQSPAAQEAAAL